jgi:hypothetical protein
MSISVGKMLMTPVVVCFMAGTKLQSLIKKLAKLTLPFLEEV